jgi:hypothetical protein
LSTGRGHMWDETRMGWRVNRIWMLDCRRHGNGAICVRRRWCGCGGENEYMSREAVVLVVVVSIGKEE